MGALGKTILIVDDERDLCEIMQFDLEDFGYQVMTATRISEALRLLDQHSIDLVISDVSMPGGNGIDLLHSIRQQSPKQPPFLFISGFSEVSVSEAYAAGVQGFLSKPLSLEQLHDAVELALKS